MAFGDAELAFIITSIVMYIFFLPAYFKLYKSTSISRGHKIGYAIIFPSLTFLGCLSIFFFQFEAPPKS